MYFYKNANGFIIETKNYSVYYNNDDKVAIKLMREGEKFFRLPLVSGLAKGDTRERLTDVQIKTITGIEQDETTIELSANSTLWDERKFFWTFYEDHIEYRHEAYGEGELGRCFFFSNGIPDYKDEDSSQGVEFNTTVFAHKFFSPKINHADQYYHTVAMPQSMGVKMENPLQGGYYPEQSSDGLFCPPPLCMAFEKNNAWINIGIGEQPGLYLFNSFEYTGSRYAGASFYVNYMQYRSAQKHFISPRIAIHFGYSEYEAMEKYIDWLDASGFTTQKRYQNATWHQLPVFCGWAEQTTQANQSVGIKPQDLATQESYEKWIKVLEERDLPIRTIVIDSKWQEHYGTHETDKNKWPDMKGFIAKQHEKGRHVLLWIPAHQIEGLNKELCILDDEDPIAADVTNPAYETYLREQIKHLVSDIGADGFKIDRVNGVINKPSVKMYAPLHGIEFLRRFQYIVYDEAHKWKPDAMIEIQAPNPIFRDTGDVLRLNDIYYGSRNVVSMMKKRARIARIAGWYLVDCDNASSTCLDEWWEYMQAQPSIGIPSLYFISTTESTFEKPPAYMWEYLKDIWREYIDSVNPS